MTEPVVWLDDGSPYNPRFKDRYRSLTGSLAQAESVFLKGCGLPAGWRGKPEFTLLETGFGLGLNFLATWAAWESDPDGCDRLHFVSVEAYPVAAAEIVRNFDQDTSLGQLDTRKAQRIQAMAAELAHVWRDLAPGLHRFSFAGGRLTLTLAVGEVVSMLSAVACAAQAVYLDGFSPSVNPEMWSPATLAAVAVHCSPGTTIATYTVAKSVRQGLKALGFEVQMCQGLPPKRDRLQGVFRPPLQCEAPA